MNFSSFEKDNKKSRIKTTKRVESSEFHKEKFPFEKKFNSFENTIKKLPADSRNIEGVHREFLPMTELLDVYEEIFGQESLAPNAVWVRCKNVSIKKPSPDLLIDANAKVGQPRYFVNRLNRELLKSLFLPSIKNTTKEAIERARNFKKDAQLFRELNKNFDEDDNL